MSWQSIRLLRAHPPQRVRDDPDRLAVFGAALEQSEQLMHAAESVGTAAQPLPLFYSLSQAGRAIAAARLDKRWRLHGHGLASTDESAEILRRTVTPQPSTKGEDRQDSFGGVSAAVGSGTLTGKIEIGAVWAAVPDLLWPVAQMPLDDPAWLWPLRAYAPHSDLDTVGMMTFARPVELLIAGLPAEADDIDSLMAAMTEYPAGEGAAVRLLQQGTSMLVYRWTATGEYAPTFVWPKITSSGPAFYGVPDLIAPNYRGRGERLLIPRLAGRDFLSPLMLWWVLLFGLSMIARYDPEQWVDAIDLRQLTAVPIEAALAEGITALPDLMLEALSA